MDTPYIDKECIYYHGEKECPYTESTQIRIWNYEATYNEAVSLEDGSHLLDYSMDLYTRDGLGDFSKEDGVSISLKSCLYLLYKKDYPEATTEHFKQWYLQQYRTK